MNKERMIQRIDELIEQANNVLRTRHHIQGVGGEHVDSGPMAGFRSASLSFLKLIFTESHPYYHEFEKHASSSGAFHAEKGLAILQAARSEIAGDWLSSLKGLIAAELFSDFLEMSDHLLETGYKGPAAVMTGCVLEEHIRQLCIKNGLDIHEEKDGREISKKVDRLNSDLAKIQAYSKLDQKMITAWLDLRNKAAHGKFDEFSSDQVQQMTIGITEFMTRVPV
jgi:hypothetical protein